MDTTYDVRIWKTDIYKGKTTTAYTVMWKVANKRWKKRFKTAALADSFRAELLSAARRGEAFDVTTGCPCLRPGRRRPSTGWISRAATWI